MNSEHGLTAENILSTLPDVLRNDEEMFAIAKSVADVLAARSEEIERIKIYTRIDTLPEELLDILAYDFKVDWWDTDYTLEEKRQTLKDSWSVHRKLGTKAAVERAISAIYKGTKVKEWFEADYRGKPYHFKLLIDATYENVDPAKHRRVLDRVSFYKNLRSWLDGVEYSANAQGTALSYVGIAAAGFAMQTTAYINTSAKVGGDMAHYASIGVAGFIMEINVEVDTHGVD